MSKARYKIVPHLDQEKARVTYTVWVYQSDFLGIRTWQWNSTHADHVQAEDRVRSLVSAEKLYFIECTRYYDEAGIFFDASS